MFPGRSPANPPCLQPDGMAYFVEKCSFDGISEDTSKALLCSVETSTLCTYRRHWKRFATWFNSEGHRGNLNPSIICNYLLHMCNKSTSTSALNSIRSAISFFTLDKLSLSEAPSIKKLFKYFYKIKPLKPRYSTFWPVSQLLEFLKTWHPMASLSL